MRLGTSGYHILCSSAHWCSAEICDGFSSSRGTLSHSWSGSYNHSVIAFDPSIQLTVRIVDIDQSLFLRKLISNLVSARFVHAYLQWHEVQICIEMQTNAIDQLIHNHFTHRTREPVKFYELIYEPKSKHKYE